MLGAVVFGHEQMQAAIKRSTSWSTKAGKPVWDWQPPAKDEALIAQGRARWPKPSCATPIRCAEAGALRSARRDLREASTRCVAGASDDAGRRATRSNDILFDIEAKIVRSQILDGEPRIDGRDTRTVRPIAIRTGVLPRTHGSALFTRGETQALVTATLGTDARRADHRRAGGRVPTSASCSTTTCRRSPPAKPAAWARRSAARSATAASPSARWSACCRRTEEFGYSMRVVSEITESNGSSSMASVCGGCLALMDAGVPMKAHVAGIAMGLIKEGNRFAVLTDILGDEDHLGDMDFKVAGTDRRHHRAADGHQDPGHHQGDHAGRAGAGAGSAACTSSARCRRRWPSAAHRAVAASRRA